MVVGYPGLLAVRFAFGAAEAGAFPSLARALARWFHVTDRAKATGIMWMATRLGAAIGIPLAALLIGWFGWRPTFVVFGAVGGCWCFFFWRWYRDDPAGHPAITASDLAYLGQDADLASAPSEWRYTVEASLHERKSMVILLDVFRELLWFLVLADLAPYVPYSPVSDLGTKVQPLCGTPTGCRCGEQRHRRSLIRLARAPDRQPTVG